MKSPIKSLEGITESDKARFWSRVKIGGPDECWPWTGTIESSGYGQVWIDKRAMKSHRISYFCFNGEPPEDKPLVCHTCDNPPCCNPDHLFNGSHQDNATDRAKKGRSAKGDRHFTRKYPEQLARGENHWSHIHPEKLARGDMNGSRLHPEKRYRGEKNRMSKLTECDVYEIRKLSSQGFCYRVIGNQFNVTIQCIYAIVKRKTWAHVPE